MTLSDEEGPGAMTIFEQCLVVGYTTVSCSGFEDSVGYWYWCCSRSRFKGWCGAQSIPICAWARCPLSSSGDPRGDPRKAEPMFNRECPPVCRCPVKRSVGVRSVCNGGRCSLVVPLLKSSFSSSFRRTLCPAGLVPKQHLHDGRGPRRRRSRGRGTCPLTSTNNLCALEAVCPVPYFAGFLLRQKETNSFFTSKPLCAGP